MEGRERKRLEKRTETGIAAKERKKEFYVPETHIMYFIRHC